MNISGGGKNFSGCSWRELAVVVALLLLFGLLFTRPLVRHFGTDVLYTHEAAPGYERVPLAQGDHLQLLYQFWLLGDSLREGRSLLSDPYQFRAGGPGGFFFQPSLLPLLTLLLSPLGLVAAYNCLTLLSFAASGLAVYLLLRLETADCWAALAGALVAALFPYRVTQLAGHANGFLSFLVPLYLYFFERSLRGARWRGWAFAAGAAYFFSGAMEFHIVYYLTLFLGIYLPFRFFFPLSDWLERRAPAGKARADETLPQLVAAGGGAGLGIAVYHAADRSFHFHQPAGWIVTALVFADLSWLLWRELRNVAAAYGETWSADFPRRLALAFAPLALLALAPLGSRFAIPNFGRALGTIALAAAAIAAVSALRRLRSARFRAEAGALFSSRGQRFLLHGIFIGLTLAFLTLVRKFLFTPSVAGGGRRFWDVTAFSPGPADLLRPVNGSAEKMVYLGVAALMLAAAGAIVARRIADPRRRLLVAFFGGTFLLGTLLAVGPHLKVFPLYHLLFNAVPMFNFPRVSARILTVAVVGLAVLAAAGLAGLRACGRHNPIGFTLFALLLIVMDYQPRRTPGLTTLPLSHPVYDLLEKERTPQEAILELPIWPGDTAWSSIYLWFATRYRHPLLNGYSPATPRNYVEEIFRPLYPLDFGEMRRPQYDLLRRLGIRFIVFHEEAYPPKIGAYPFAFAAANLLASPYLEAIAYEPPLRLFRLRPEPPAGEVSFTRTSPVGSLYEGEQWLVAPGETKVDTLASGGAAALFPAGPAGPLNRVFPRRVYPTGSYRIRARFLATDSSPAPALRLTVKDAASGIVLATAAGTPARASGGIFDLAASCTLADLTPLLVELATDGAGPARWDFLDVTFAAEPEPRLDYEVEDLWHIGRPLADPGASGGTEVQLIPGYHPRDHAFSGPDRVLPAGRWQAELRYRAASGPAPEEERFEVLLANRPEPLTFVALPVADSGAPIWRSVSLPFALARSAPVRFRVFFNGGRELALDKITLRRTE